MTTPVSSLTVKLFGRPRIMLGAKPEAFPVRPGTRALFIALAFAASPFERSWLCATLWPDVTENTARANLRRHVLYIRQWLRELTGCDEPVLRSRDQLALDPQIIAWLDVRAFDDAFADGRFDDAANFYTGDLLVDSDDEWIVAERQRLRARFDEVLLSLVTGARARNEPETALRYAQVARTTDPYNEAWLRTIMRLRYVAGDRSGALREFESYRGFVRAELDVDPMPETLMLADSMRRLVEDTTPTSLPCELTTFVGRVDEEHRLSEHVMERRLVTVSGEPGIGKSRLAVRCGRSLSAMFRDGIVIVDAIAAADTAELERILIRELARRTTPAPDTSLIELARNLHALIIIDGCENLQHACADVAQRLLVETVDIRILATSRIALGLEGETIFRLGPLTSQDAIALFFERTNASDRGHRLGVTHVSIAKRICSELDALPLAIELAAARVRVSTLEEVARDVGRFAERPGFDKLYATYESSYQLLNGMERAVLRRLAAFANGWSTAVALAACADIASPKDVIMAFATLVQHSLIIPPAMSEVGVNYSMLDATRNFAAYRARTLGETEPDARALAEAIAQHYVMLDARLRGPQAADHFDAIERDRENIENALAILWCGDANDRRLAVDLSLAVSRFWADQGFAREGARWLRKGLDENVLDGTKRLELVRVIATLTRNFGDYETSFRDFSELARLQEEAHASGPEIGKAHILAANAARMSGNFDEALRRTQIAFDVFTGSGEAYLAAWAMYALGTTLLSAGRFAEAAVGLQRATDNFNELDAVADSSSSIGNLALCHYYEGRFGVAQELADESLARAGSSGHRYYYAHAALNQAQILHALGERDPAWAFVIEASTIGEAIGAHDVLISCAEIASAILVERQPDDAALLLGSADNARERFHAHRFPVDRPLYDIARASLTDALGAERFEALWTRGRVLTLRDAVERLCLRTP